MTLIGFGMGARVIIQCLLHLAEMGEKGHGIIETAGVFLSGLVLSGLNWHFP